MERFSGEERTAAPEGCLPSDLRAERASEASSGGGEGWLSEAVYERVKGYTSEGEPALAGGEFWGIKVVEDEVDEFRTVIGVD